MSESLSRNEHSNQLRAGIAALAITVGLVVAVVPFWKLFAFTEFPFDIPGSFYFLGIILVFQFVRSVGMDDWKRRGAALASVVGLVVMIIGLGPSGYCATSSPPQCGTNFDIRPTVLFLGLLLTTAMLYFDIRRR
ncbi:hypothetical protein [Haladaptatus salinisoli]|uniref:hypothetical protein n=1 Tax=Haladaptatus salinisoli TaxID=2884876 RepID=UPI001D0A6A13|nr:hypothetical protein [Haladaptatus salinisoli]